jgi:hypothetical protein
MPQRGDKQQEHEQQATPYERNRTIRADPCREVAAGL